MRIKIKGPGRRAPVVLAKEAVSRRTRARNKTIPVDHEVLSEPLPGPMLVLLSRLHRSERWRGDEDEAR